MTVPLEREALLPRIDGIGKNIARLRELSALPIDAFSHGDAFDLAQHHLRLALEGVFHIGSHILSRLPGGRPACATCSSTSIPTSIRRACRIF